ncbi:hypothetical protein NA57DRAFT_81833 [Rhizodiscina lignyota]|uniref:Uncharacterized protein n=1 Tax=Rhizodiscina lignyota TaxID=1504668 RepID=A0A9P4I4A1_9PEZI|nr:hypothetical protein NA57DRAFT_81833 [Rhizodiscina lignyota]
MKIQRTVKSFTLFSFAVIFVLLVNFPTASGKSTIVPLFPNTTRHSIQNSFANSNDRRSVQDSFANSTFANSTDRYDVERTSFNATGSSWNDTQVTFSNSTQGSFSNSTDRHSAQKSSWNSSQTSFSNSAQTSFWNDTRHSVSKSSQPPFKNTTAPFSNSTQSSFSNSTQTSYGNSTHDSVSKTIQSFRNSTESTVKEKIQNSTNNSIQSSFSNSTPSSFVNGTRHSVFKIAEAYFKNSSQSSSPKSTQSFKNTSSGSPFRINSTQSSFNGTQTAFNDTGNDFSLNSTNRHSVQNSLLDSIVRHSVQGSSNPKPHNQYIERGQRFMCLIAATEEEADENLGYKSQSSITELDQIDMYGWTMHEDDGAKPSKANDQDEFDFKTNPAIKSALEEMSLNIEPSWEGGDNFVMTAVQDQEFDKDGTKHKATEGSYTFIMNPVQGMLIAWNAISPQAKVKEAEDTHQENGPTTVPEVSQFSDIAYVNWDDVTQDKAGGIRGIIHPHIWNIDTMTVLYRIFTNNPDAEAPKELLSIPGSKAWPGTTYKPDTDEFNALLGTPLGSGVAWFLIQHKEALNTKTIQHIIVFHDDTDEKQPCILWAFNDKGGTPGG